MVFASLAAASLVLATAACSSAAPETDGEGPIVIGMSLPLSGPVADVSKSGYEGYQQWVTDVNAAGGLLGRQVELDVLDDGFDPDAAVANYNKLISQDKVDLVLGTFSSHLNGPASAVAERQGMLYIEPSGGDPALFTRGFTKLFFAQPATGDALPDRFVEWVASLPADQQPRTAAFLSQDDPSVSGAIEVFVQKFEAMGIKTVYNEVYAPDTATFDNLASAVAGAQPDLIVQGAVTSDGVQFVRSLQKIGYTPKILFQTQSPADPSYPDAIGTGNADGIFTAVGWSPDAGYPGNADFVSGYTASFGAAPSEDAANSYTAGQVLQAAVNAVGSLDQTALADWLHANTVQTIVGPLKWDKTGAPGGTLLLAQIQDGTLQIISPKAAATVDTAINPKPSWQG
ncbi:MAG TPA: amino acid ABC transporter substrate-binding protein [Pseudolysinimonas sp.]|nr:amino acid ABC transporter substrate-binding protein [Pseudolysinimonas sp.]